MSHSLLPWRTFPSVFIYDKHFHTCVSRTTNKSTKTNAKYRKTKIISCPPVVFVSSSIRFLIAFWDSFSFSSSSLRSAGNILINILLKIFCKCVMSTLLLLYLEMTWFWIICHALQQLVETVGYWRQGEYDHLHYLNYSTIALLCVTVILERTNAVLQRVGYNVQPSVFCQYCCCHLCCFPKWYWIICKQRLVETVGYRRQGEYNHLHCLKYSTIALLCVTIIF